MASERMDTDTKVRLRIAANQAARLYPGPVGELINQEVQSWMVFGHVLGSVLIMRVDHDIIQLADRTSRDAQ